MRQLGSPCCIENAQQALIVIIAVIWYIWHWHYQFVFPSLLLSVFPNPLSIWLVCFVLSGPLLVTPQFSPHSRLCSVLFLLGHCFPTTADLGLRPPYLSSFLLHSLGGGQESRMTLWFLIFRGACRKKKVWEWISSLAFSQDVYYRRKIRYRRCCFAWLFR